MEKKPRKNMSIRVDVELLEQIRCIAKQEGRTISKQAYYWLRRAVRAYQQEQEEKK